MAIPIRRPWQPAAALAIALSCALAPPPAQPAQPAMLDAGAEGGYAFAIEAQTVKRDGDRVRFRLLATNEAGADHYDSAIEVDCVHRTRRQLSAVADDGQGQVRHYGDEMSSPHPVSQGTRADRELRLACTRVGLRAAEPPHLAAAASELADADNDATGAHAIFIATVRRRDATVDYMLQTIARGQANATRQHIVGDCARKLRGVVEDDTSPAGTSVPARRVAAGSREERELATACALPEGPPSRWFAGVVVTADGMVVAPHARTQGCNEVSTGVGPARRKLDVVASEDDITLLRIRGGGPWPVMPASGEATSSQRQPVTLLGLHGLEPRASAAFAEQAGTNDADPGWPQVRMLTQRALTEGVVWNADGVAIGIALALGKPVDRHGQSFVRMLPASQVRLRLQRHQADWRVAQGNGLDGETAMRLAISATLPLICTR